MIGTDRHARRRAERRGRRAEAVAAVWLQLKGYHILARRARPGAGEIDVIARHGQTLAFIEVKRRPDLRAGLEAVPDAAWRRISRAAAAWASARPGLGYLGWRYDLIVISPWRLPRHLRDYWRP